MRLAQTDRFAFIDALRGIAALMVMTQHTLYQSGLLIDRRTGLEDGFIPTWLELGETGVVTFFLVSGFVIPFSLERAGELRRFWLHRVLRIYPLYLFVLLIGLAVHVGRGPAGPDHYARSIAAHLLMVQEYVGVENLVGGSWTLSLEFAWYAAVAAAAWLMVLQRTKVVVAAAIGVSTLGSAACMLGWHMAMGRLSMLVAATLGLVCYHVYQRRLTRRSGALLAALLLGTIATNLLIGFGLFPSAHPTASLRMVTISWSLALACFGCAFLWRTSVLWGHPVLLFLGRISYSVYLIHPVILGLLKDTSLHGLTLIVFTFPATILVSYATFNLIEGPGQAIGRLLSPRAA